MLKTHEHRILTYAEIDTIWKDVKPSNFNGENKRGNIPLIKTTIDAALLNSNSFDIAKCYSLCAKNLNHKEKPHKQTIQKIKDLINNVESFFFYYEYCDYWCGGYTDDFFSRSTNTTASVRDHYILNTLNFRLKKLMEEERWDVCINQIIIALASFNAEKTSSFHILRKFALLIAPFLPYTAERVWHTLPGKNKRSIFCEDYPVADNWFSRKNYTLYKVFINDDTQFTYESYDFLDDNMTLETFKESIALTKHLEGRMATKFKLIKDRYIIVNAE